MDFALSADDLTAYAAGTVTEPASVAMLRFVVWLLVAPHGALGALLTTGTPEASIERGAIGRTLVALCDHNLRLAGTRPEAQQQREALLAWRAAFAQRFGIPIAPSSSREARWAALQLSACLTPAAEMLPTEPEFEAVARRAKVNLCDDSQLSGRPCAPGVHCEHRWLTGEALHLIRAAAQQAMATLACSSRCGSGAGRVAIDLLDPAVWPELPRALVELARCFERLRLELAHATGLGFQDTAELSLVSLPAGCVGETRQLDVAEPSTEAEAGPLAAVGADRVGRSERLLSRRSLSLRLWLHDQGPGALTALRAPGGPHAGAHVFEPRVRGADCGGAAAATDLVVVPSSGMLLIFDSEGVPHQTWPPARDQLYVSCWLREGAVAKYHRSGLINLASVVLQER